MSHEIRTPMNGILGMTHLAFQTKLDTKQLTYIENIDKSAKLLLEIINDILDFSKIEAGKVSLSQSNFSMQQLLSDISAMFRYKADEKNLIFEVNCTCPKNTIFYGDKLRISQVLINLLSNAFKFTLQGKISLKIQALANNLVKFQVKDTGIGIAQKDIPKLFQSFSQADGTTARKYGGTGLGLAISKELVTLMGGELLVESKVGEGSCFYFELPLYKGDRKDIDTTKPVVPHHHDLSKQIQKIQTNKMLPLKQRDALFEQLSKYAQKRRSKPCGEVLDKIFQYKLSKEDEEFLLTIKNLLKNRNYKQIMEKLNGK